MFYELDRLLKEINKKNRFFFLSKQNDNYLFDCWNYKLYKSPSSLYISDDKLMYREIKNLNNIEENIIFLTKIIQVENFYQDNKIQNNSMIFEVNEKYEEIIDSLSFEDIYNTLLGCIKDNKLLFVETIIKYFKPFFFIIFSKQKNLCSNYKKCYNCSFCYLCRKDLKVFSCKTLINSFKKVLEIIISLNNDFSKIEMEAIIKKINQDLSITTE